MPTDRIGRFATDESGAVAVIVSLMMTVLLGFVALGVDVAWLFGQRAQLQSIADLSAMSAVTTPNSADARANYVMERNTAAPLSIDTLQTGRFLRNPEIPPDQRFAVLPPGTPGINALRLAVEKDAKLYFASVLTSASSLTLNRASLATRTGAASYSLDSAILRLDGEDLNRALRQSFGTSATISIANMDVLANTTVNLGTLVAALEALQPTGSRNPAEILNVTTTGANLVAALQSALPVGLRGSVDQVRTASGTARFDVASLVGGIDTDLGLTATDFLSEINVSALDVIRSMVAAQSGNRSIEMQATVATPGVLSSKTTLSAGEPPAESGLIALGEPGVQLQRAAVRLATESLLEPSLLGNLGIGIQAVSLALPLHTEIAGSAASLIEQSCNIVPDGIAASFSTAPTPLHPSNGTSVAALYLGSLPQGTGSGLINPATLDFTDLLTVNLRIDLPLLPAIVIPGLTIQARSHVAVGTSKVDTVSFTHADVAAGRTVKTFGSGDLLSSAVSGLFSPDKMQLRIKPTQTGLITGLAAPLVADLLRLLPARLLSTLVGPVDALLDATLDDLGVDLGAGELSLTGHHCEPIRLVR